jgi:non-ribosomal peptide synthetase-like protein
LTHEPGIIRRFNRILWEVLRFGIPLLPLILAFAWLEGIYLLDTSGINGLSLTAGIVLLSFFIVLIPGFVTLTSKWILMGRVKPDRHVLWSCWCSRWDFLYMVWDSYARRLLIPLEGTLLLNMFLRLMGMRIGKRVILGRGFAQVVDPDMLEFEDNATVNCLLQAHTFEDRVLKIDYVYVRRGATVQNGALLLYGADIGEDTIVSRNSVVMKKERLLPRRVYSGCPSRNVAFRFLDNSHLENPGEHRLTDRQFGDDRNV